MPSVVDVEKNSRLTTTNPATITKGPPLTTLRVRSPSHHAPAAHRHAAYEPFHQLQIDLPTHLPPQVPAHHLPPQIPPHQHIFPAANPFQQPPQASLHQKQLLPPVSLHSQFLPPVSLHQQQLLPQASPQSTMGQNQVILRHQ